MRLYLSPSHTLSLFSRDSRPCQFKITLTDLDGAAPYQTKQATETERWNLTTLVSFNVVTPSKE
jgi:hypothetical protein